VAYQTPEHRLAGIREIMDALEGVRSVILITHLNADGDGAGCESALASWLRARGVEAWIINPTPFPTTFEFILEDPTWVVDVKSDRAKELCRAADLALIVDTGEVQRIGRVKPLIDHLPTAVIDHHPPGEDPIGGASFRDPTAAAAGELVHDLIHSQGGPWSESSVNGLYVAILTDTGSFAFSNTLAPTYRVMASLVDLGARPEPLHRACYGSVAESRLRLLSYCLDTLGVDEEGTTAWMVVPRDAFDAVGATLEDLEGLADYPRSIDGVQVGILLRTTDDGSTKISLRSNGPTDVNAVARSLGGGGHVRAAGALIRRPVDEVLPEVVAAVRAAVRAAVAGAATDDSVVEGVA
jgi:phosphoesterase RecJ-like protein